MLAEDLFDHHIERFGVLSLGVPDQAAQALKILRGIAQAVDVIEPQALQLAFRDQLSDQAMDGLEGAGILDPQSGQRIDVKKAPIIDVAGGEPPVAESVVLTFEQMMQRQDLRRPLRTCLRGVEPTRDNVSTPGDAFQLRLEIRRFRAIGMPQPPVARCEVEDTFSRRVTFSAGFLDARAQNLAVTLGRDRQAMFE